MRPKHVHPEYLEKLVRALATACVMVTSVNVSEGGAVLAARFEPVVDAVVTAHVMNQYRNILCASVQRAMLETFAKICHVIGILSNKCPNLVAMRTLFRNEVFAVQEESASAIPTTRAFIVKSLLVSSATPWTSV